MRRPPRPPIHSRIKALNEEKLIQLHVVDPVPFLPRIVSELPDFSSGFFGISVCASWRDDGDGTEIGVGDCGCVADC